MKNSRKYSRSFRPKESIHKASNDTEPYIGESGTAPVATSRVKILAETDSLIQPLIRRSMFWCPVYSDGDGIEHVPLIFWLVDVLRPRLAVEVGNVSPVSYFALCQAAQRLEVDTHCAAIDTTLERVDFLRSYAAQYYHSFSSVAFASFEDASGSFGLGTIGLLHLNLSFVNDIALNQPFDNWLNNWLARVIDGGILLISGTGIQSKNIWLRDIVSKLKQNYSVFEFTAGTGLCLVSIGRNLPEPLASFFGTEALDGAGRNSVRELFSRLGKSCADAHALRLLERDASVSSRKIAELQKHEESSRAEKIADLTAEIEGLRQQAIVMEDELLQSRKTVGEHTLKINTLGMELKQADAIKGRQTQELAILTKLLLQAEEKLEKMQAEFAALASTSKSAQQASSRVSDRKQRRLPGLLRVFGGGSRDNGKKLGGAKFLQAQKLLLGSALFDEKWYLNQYRDVASSSLSPVEHYLTIGATLGYDPSANFDSSYYLNTYRDVADSGMNPLVHYLRFGISENRKPKAN